MIKMRDLLNEIFNKTINEAYDHSPLEYFLINSFIFQISKNSFSLSFTCNFIILHLEVFVHSHLDFVCNFDMILPFYFII